jgi:hypothetical protein
VESDADASPDPGPLGEAGTPEPGLLGEAGTPEPGSLGEACAPGPGLLGEAPTRELLGEAGTRIPGAAQAPYSRRAVPPNSSALRELLATVAFALEVKPPTEARDLAAYRYLLVARARAVRRTARRLLDDREADDEDVMIAVWALRDQLRDLTPTYQEHPLAS